MMMLSPNFLRDYRSGEYSKTLDPDLINGYGDIEAKSNGSTGVRGEGLAGSTQRVTDWRGLFPTSSGQALKFYPL